MKYRVALTTALLIPTTLATTTALGDDLFNVVITTGGQSIAVGFNDAKSSFDAFDEDAVKAQFPDFDKELDGAVAQIDYRGLPIMIEYPENSPSVNLSVPSLGINQAFSEATRSDSLEDLKDFLSKDGGTLLNQINGELAAVSPSDPIAGNPTSLMSQMVDEGFDSGFSDNQSTGAVTNMNQEAATDNQLAMSMRFGKYTAEGKDVQSLALPLSYTIRFDDKPKNQLHLSLPIHYSKTEDAASYRVGLGVGYSFPIRDNWSITPDISYGLMGSVELGSVGAIVGGSVTSRYNWALGEGGLAMGNMIGSYQTQALEYDDYEVDSELSNVIFKNGLMYNRKLTNRIAMEFIFSDTRFTGNELFVQRSNEIGVSFGTTGTGNELLDSYAKIGLTYMFTDQSELDGIRLNLGVSF